jgi:hypothetical protein
LQLLIQRYTLVLTVLIGVPFAFFEAPHAASATQFSICVLTALMLSHQFVVAQLERACFSNG